MSAEMLKLQDNNYFVPPLPIPRKYREGGETVWQRLRTLERVINSPLEAFGDFHYEQPFSQGSYLGVVNTIINDPRIIRHCFLENAANYGLSPVRQAVLKPLLGEGLLTIEGQDWRRARKLLSPVFSPRSVGGFARAMRSAAENFLPALDNGGQKVLVSPLMSEVTYLVLSETLFSGEINADAERTLQSVSFLLEKKGKPGVLDLMNAPSWIPRPGKIQGRKVIPEFKGQISDTIRNRRDKINKGEDVPEDFLTLLLRAEDEGEQFTEQEVKDNILTFIAAGHETTSRGLTWTLYLLSQSPEFLKKIEDEIDVLYDKGIAVEEWMDHLPWTLACFEESMRIYPPAAIMTRGAIEDDEFDGYKIPKGSQVILAPWILHRHKTLWEHPERFDPERFYGENRKKIDRFAYLPFGAGPRVCIGQRFALQEAVIVLAVLLRHYRFEYASKAPPWPVLKITLQTDNDMPMRIYKK